MKPELKTARIVSALILLSFVLGVLLNQFLQGPIIFGGDFLTEASANSNQIIISALLGLVSGVIPVAMAAILLPIFEPYNKPLSFLYFGSSIIGFSIVLVDNISILSILGLSNEYVQAGAPDADYFQTLATVLYQTRWWTHYLVLIIACFPLFVFYQLLFQSRIIPRFISIWGLLAVILMLTELLFSIFGHSISMNLLIPFGLNQIFLAIWLIIKGFIPPDQ